MKKVIIVFSTLILVFIIYLIISINKKNECIPFSGGSYNLIFITNSEEKIEDISVCIACPPDSYDNLPTPKKNGYIFDGWYYDKKLKNKVTGTKTNDIPPVSEIDKNNCAVGYKDIELYAKWITK